MAKNSRSKPAEGNELIGRGVGIGAFGLVSTALLGATCPLCVVAAPALVGAGLYSRWKSRRNASSKDAPAERPPKA